MRMFLIFCRFFTISLLLSHADGFVSLNDSRIQVLLSNSSISLDKLDFQNRNQIETDADPIYSNCKIRFIKWLNILNDIKNEKCENRDDCLDALDQLDAFARYPTSGSPIIYDGSFGKCNNLNKKGSHRRKYCYLIQTDEEMNCRKENDSVLYAPNRTAFGICGPEVCQGKEYATIFRNLKKPFNFMIDRPVCAAFCTSREISNVKMDYLSIVFVVLLMCIVLFSSVYDYIRDTRYHLSSEYETQIGRRVILCWSLWSNLQFLFQEPRSGYIKSLDFLRAITFTWVVGQNVIGHLSFYDKEVRIDPYNYTITSAALSSLTPVYTYLFLSGLTMAYVFTRANHPVDVLKRPFTWLIFYFHRWIRLTFPLMAFIAVFVAYGRYIQGPYDALTGYSMVTQTDQCTYWKDIIHISNFVNVHEMCYLPAWHLALDFQFTLVAPIFLLAFHYSFVLEYAFVDCFPGTILAVITSLISSGFTIYFFVQNEILHSAFTGDHEVDDKLVEIILSKPWNQMTSYMIGVIVGSALGRLSGSQKIMHPVASTTIWILAVVSGMAAIVLGSYGASQIERAIINVSTRAIWSFCITWIVVSSEMKWAGPIGFFFEHPFWRPLGKLTFCAFIIHHMILYFVFNMEEQAPKYTSFQHEYFHYTIPIVTLSYFLAFFLSLMVELPILKLDKLLQEKLMPARNEKKMESDSRRGENSDLDENYDSEPKTKRLEDGSEENNSNEEMSYDEPLLSSSYY